MFLAFSLGAHQRINSFTVKGFNIRTLGLAVIQRNKDTGWNNQPLSSPIVLQNESQKPGQKALKKIEKHNSYLLVHSESPMNLIFQHKICFLFIF